MKILFLQMKYFVKIVTFRDPSRETRRLRLRRRDDSRKALSRKLTKAKKTAPNVI